MEVRLFDERKRWTIVPAAQKRKTTSPRFKTTDIRNQTSNEDDSSCLVQQVQLAGGCGGQLTIRTFPAKTRQQRTTQPAATQPPAPQTTPTTSPATKTKKPKKRERTQTTTTTTRKDKNKKEKPPARCRRRFTKEESDAVMEGFAKHGNKWVTIKKDPQFATVLAARTAQDIRYKYRNLMKRDKDSAVLLLLNLRGNRPTAVAETPPDAHSSTEATPNTPPPPKLCEESNHFVHAPRALPLSSLIPVNNQSQQQQQQQQLQSSGHVGVVTRSCVNLTRQQAPTPPVGLETPTFVRSSSEQRASWQPSSLNATPSTTFTPVGMASSWRKQQPMEFVEPSRMMEPCTPDDSGISDQICVGGTSEDSNGGRMVTGTPVEDIKQPHLSLGAVQKVLDMEFAKEGNL